MSFVGLDPDRATRLVTLLDGLAKDAEDHQKNVAGLLRLAQKRSDAPDRLAKLSHWAKTLKADMRWRIDVINQASRPGPDPIRRLQFRYDTRDAAVKAGERDGKKMKKLMDSFVGEGDDAALREIEKYLKKALDHHDPAYLAAYLKALGHDERQRLLARLSLDRGPDGLARLAAVLAAISRQDGPLDATLKKFLSEDPQSRVLGDSTIPDKAHQLVTLLGYGGYGDEFIAQALAQILRNTPSSSARPDPGNTALQGMLEDRKFVLDMLKARPELAFRLLARGDNDGIKSLLNDPEGAEILKRALIDYPKASTDRSALEHVIQVVAKNPPMTAGVKQKLAFAFKGEFRDGTINKTIDNDDGRLRLGKEGPVALEKCMAALMTDKTAAAILFAEAGDYAALQFEKVVANLGPGPDVKAAAQAAAAEVGKTIGVLDQALAIMQDKAKADVGLSTAVLKFLGNAAASGGLALSEFSAGTSALVGAGLSEGVDRGADALKNVQLDKLKGQAKQSWDHVVQSEASIMIARTLLKDPAKLVDFAGDYRVSDMLDSKNQLKPIDPRDAETVGRLNEWLHSKAIGISQDQITGVAVGIEDGMRLAPAPG